MVLSSLFFFVLLTTANICHAAFHFTDCGHGEVKSLQLSGCSNSDNSNSCVIFKGKSVHLAGDFTANQNASHVEIEIKAKLNGSGIEMTVPGVESTNCNHVTCPLVRGMAYHFAYDLVLAKFLPTARSSVTAKLVNADVADKERALISCINFNVDVRESYE